MNKFVHTLPETFNAQTIIETMHWCHVDSYFGGRDATAGHLLEGNPETKNADFCLMLTPADRLLGYVGERGLRCSGLPAEISTDLTCSWGRQSRLFHRQPVTSYNHSRLTDSHATELDLAPLLPWASLL